MQYLRGKTWWVKFGAGGKTVRRSAGTASRKEAREFERALRSKIAQDLRAGRSGKPVARTFQDGLLRWINEGAPKSMWSHARNVRPYLDRVPIESVVPAAHAMKADMRKQGLSVMTINRRLAVVRRVLNVAYREWDWLREPLGEKIQLFSEKGMAREIYLSRAEVDTLLDAVENETAKRVILLAAYTGLRRGELLSLQPSNWQSPYIVLTSKTKGKKARTVPVIEEAQELVKPLPFGIHEEVLRSEFERAREAIGRPDIRLHDLRHSFASWLAQDSDMPLTTIRDLLGHSSLSVTSKYTHLRGDTLAAVSGALQKNRAFSSQSGHNQDGTDKQKYDNSEA
jgi:integrase